LQQQKVNNNNNINKINNKNNIAVFFHNTMVTEYTAIATILFCLSSLVFLPAALCWWAEKE